MSLDLYHILSHHVVNTWKELSRAETLVVVVELSSCPASISTRPSRVNNSWEEGTNMVHDNNME